MAFGIDAGQIVINIPGLDAGRLSDALHWNRDVSGDAFVTPRVVGDDLKLKNVGGDVIVDVDVSAETLEVGNQTTPTDGVIDNKSAAGVIKNKINSAGDQFFNGGKVAFGGTTPNTQFHNFGGTTRNVTVVNAATYDLLITDDILHDTYSATASSTRTLPTAQTVAGRVIVIKDGGFNASANNIVVGTEGAETIDGNATDTINGDGDWRMYYSDGSDWFIIS